MIDAITANEFISSPDFSTRLRRAVTIAWEIFGRKVGGGLIPVNKEASMQLQYAYVLKQLLPMILTHPSEQADVELETSQTVTVFFHHPHTLFEIDRHATQIVGIDLDARPFHVQQNWNQAALDLLVQRQ